MTSINADHGGYELGGYREVALPRVLRTYAEVAWSYGRNPSRADGVIPEPGHRLIPEPGVSVAFFCRRDRAGRVDAPQLILIGPVRTVRYFAPEPDLHIEAIRLKPEWCRVLLGVDPAEHDDALDELPGPLARRLAPVRDRLARTTAPIAALELLEEALASLARGCRDEAPARRSQSALDTIRRQPCASIERVAARVGLAISERHLRRLVRETTGRGLKYFQRVRRLHEAVSTLEAGNASWPRLAAVAGYYDQAHLINEFRALTGVTPPELQAERATQRSPVAAPR